MATATLDHAATEAQADDAPQFITLTVQIWRYNPDTDESRWDEWEALLTDDMHYWVPINEIEDPSGLDPSIINDNRSRLATRLRYGAPALPRHRRAWRS